MLILAMVVLLVWKKREHVYIPITCSQAQRSKSTHITRMVTLIFLVLSPIKALSLIVYVKRMWNQTNKGLFYLYYPHYSSSLLLPDTIFPLHWLIGPLLQCNNIWSDCHSLIWCLPHADLLSFDTSHNVCLHWCLQRIRVYVLRGLTWLSV